jgi:hypothetical protein
MGYDNIAELMLSMFPKRHIKSKKRRIRKKYAMRDRWKRKMSEEEKKKLSDLWDHLGEENE